MKAITIHQPWASLIAIEAKRFETRGWKTNYRGQIAIHASKKDPHDMMRSLPSRVQQEMYGTYYEHFNIQSGALKHMPTGVIVAIADLVECWAVGEDYQSGMPALFNGAKGETKRISAREEKFGFYENGRYAWELANVQVIDPIPVNGQQGLWSWNGFPEASETTEPPRGEASEAV